MADHRDVIWTADCPPSIYQVRVTLDSAAWAHAVDGHPEVEPHVEAARDAIENPSAVHQSNNNPKSILFFNSSVTNEQGHALVVPVLVSGFEGIVTSTYFRPVNYSGRVIWKP